VTDEPARPDETGPGDPAVPAIGPAGSDDDPTAPRPWLERIGLAAIAVVMGGLFAVVALAAGSGGEWILAAMSAVGAFVTLAVGLSTLVRG
jgi:hypothetical protein